MHALQIHNHKLTQFVHFAMCREMRSFVNEAPSRRSTRLTRQEKQRLPDSSSSSGGYSGNRPAGSPLEGSLGCQSHHLSSFASSPVSSGGRGRSRKRENLSSDATSLPPGLSTVKREHSASKRAEPLTDDSSSSLGKTGRDAERLTVARVRKGTVLLIPSPSDDSDAQPSSQARTRSVSRSARQTDAAERRSGSNHCKQDDRHILSQRRGSSVSSFSSRNSRHSASISGTPPHISTRYRGQRKGVPGETEASKADFTTQVHSAAALDVLDVHREPLPSETSFLPPGKAQSKDPQKPNWAEIDSELEAAYQLLQHTIVDGTSVPLSGGRPTVEEEYRRVVSEILDEPLSS